MYRVRVEVLNGIMGSRFSWVYDALGGDTDRYYRQEFEEYLSGRKEAGEESEDLKTHGNEWVFMKLLSAE